MGENSKKVQESIDAVKYFRTWPRVSGSSRPTGGPGLSPPRLPVANPLVKTNRHLPCSKSKSLGSSTASPAASNLRAAASAAVSSFAVASKPLSNPAIILCIAI